MVERVERSIRYQFGNVNINSGSAAAIFEQLHDRMTECVYEVQPITFGVKVDRSKQNAVRHVSLVDCVDECTARANLQRENVTLGLALDEWDVDYYVNLFRTKIRRNPTDVELFDLAQSNSEHSRHWFFKVTRLHDDSFMNL